MKYRSDIVLSSANYAPQVIIGMPLKQDYRYIRKYNLNIIEEEKVKNIYKKLMKQSAIVTYELGLSRNAVNEKKVKCPLFFIGTRQARISPSEIIKRLADKYYAEYILYDCCHHFFSNDNWCEIAEGIHNFIMKI